MASSLMSPFLKPIPSLCPSALKVSACEGIVISLVFPREVSLVEFPLEVYSPSGTGEGGSNGGSGGRPEGTGRFSMYFLPLSIISHGF